MNDVVQVPAGTRKPAVRPRDAASLILLRGEEGVFAAGRVLWLVTLPHFVRTHLIGRQGPVFDGIWPVSAARRRTW